MAFILERLAHAAIDEGRHRYVEGLEREARRNEPVPTIPRYTHDIIEISSTPTSNYMNDVYRCFEIYIIPSETRTYPLFIFDGRNTKWDAENGMVRTKAKMADLLEQRAGRVEEYELTMKAGKWQCLNGGVIPEEVRRAIYFAIHTTFSCDRVKEFAFHEKWYERFYWKGGEDWQKEEPKWYQNVKTRGNIPGYKDGVPWLKARITRGEMMENFAKRLALMDIPWLKDI
jgi:hypothetical protein